MYRVLYRKYRPRFFEDVIGQSQVTDTLKSEINSERLAHAYLFTGSRGTGKTTCSKILSKAVNCLNPKNGDPCGECEMCRGIDDGSVLDVVEIDAASNNGVDDIRMLREEAGFTPANAKYRVYIIDEVHMLSIGAFNALLKTLEEPPQHVIFILATTEVHKLPATILSRCQRFDFHRISPSDIADRLEFVCSSEGVEIDRNAAVLIAGTADGAMRDALSLLDQCIGKGERITEEIVRKTAGLADKSHLISITQNIIDGDCASSVNTVDLLYKDSKDMARLCEELTEHLRNIMLIKTVKNPHDILVIPQEDFKKTSEQAGKLPLQRVVSAIDILQSAKEKMFRGVNRKIEMELTVIKLCSPTVMSSAYVDNSELEKRINIIERKISQISSGIPVSGNQNKSSSQLNVLPPIKKIPNENMELLRKNAVPMTKWAEVVDEMKKYSKTIGAGFDGSVAYTSGEYVLVDSNRDICFELLRDAEQRNRMREIIFRITGKHYKLGRYYYPDEKKEEDKFSQLISDFKSAGVPVEENK